VNIVQCLPCLYAGGVEQYTLRLIQSLSQRHHSTLIAPNGPGEFIFSEAGIDVRSFRNIEYDFLTGFNSLRTQFKRVAVENMPDIIHVHVESFLLHIANRALPKVPRIFTTHGIWAASGWALEERVKFRMTAWAINKWADAAFAVSADQGKKLIAHGADPRKVTVIQNGAPVPQTTEDAPKKILNRFNIDPETHLVVGTLARLSSDKSLGTLIEAARILHADYPNLRWIIAGEGPERGSLERQITALGLQGIVVLAGFMKPAGDLLKSVDIYVQPSAHEAFSLAILEAMAMKLPVVASNIGGIDEQILQGKTGALFAKGQALSLAIEIKPFLDCPELRARTGIAGQDRYFLEFTQQIAVSKTEALYEQVISANKS
jgi:L-malate glycosyltransferase